MKFIKSLLSLVIVAAIGIGLITTRPTKAEFAEYYVNQNQTGLGSFVDTAWEKIVQQLTEENNYLVFSVFEIDDERYVGIGGHIFGKSSAEQVSRTVEGLIEKVEKNLDEK